MMVYDKYIGGENMHDKIIAVQRMQDYIEKHINESISLGDLAEVCLFGRWD